jgi:YkoY family integral membrane protein
LQFSAAIAGSSVLEPEGLWHNQTSTPMFGQTFQPGDLANVAALTLLEGLLSADNALVLAIMVRHLPKHQQQKALLYGLVGAFAFRLVAILLAGYVLQLWWLQAIGAAYLLFLPIKHFISRSGGPDAKPVGAGFWMTVIAVDIADIAFAIDSVLAGVAFINNPNKLWVVYLGAVIGIVLLRFAAGAFIRLLEKYPVLDHVAYILVGWVGIKLAMLAGHSFHAVNSSAPAIIEMPPIIFWGGLLVIAGGGALFAFKNPRSDVSDLEDEALIADDVEDWQVDQKVE